MAIEIVPVERRHLDGLRARMHDFFHRRFSKNPALVAILESHTQKTTEHYFDKAKDAIDNPKTIFLLALEGDRIVGFTVGAHAPEVEGTAESYYTCSMKEQRGRRGTGIGGPLLEKKIEIMLQGGAKRIRMEPLHGISARMIRNVGQKFGLRVTGGKTMTQWYLTKVKKRKSKIGRAHV